jgi:hypothetical protein
MSEIPSRRSRYFGNSIAPEIAVVVGYITGAQVVLIEKAAAIGA